jgi:putative Holliday junction resolvase
MGHKPTTHANFAALDVGSKRIGVAVATAQARLAHPLTTLMNDDDMWLKLAEILHHESVGTVIVGLPRGLDGQETAQTAFCRDFADQAAQHLGLPIVLQDEALTSQQAEAELAGRSAVKNRGEVDSLAATYILEDYLREHQ